MSLMQHRWDLPVRAMDSAKMLMAKFKNLRRVLKCRYAQISNLATSVHNCKLVIILLNKMEEFRDLALQQTTNNKQQPSLLVSSKLR
jgi:hypothetical protein